MMEMAAKKVFTKNNIHVERGYRMGDDPREPIEKSTFY